MSGATGSSRWRRSFDRAIESRIYRTLESWRDGHLVVHTPDGETRFFGPPSDDVAELHIVDRRFFRRLALGSDIGIGESYMAGEWTSPDLPHLISAFIRNRDYLEVDAQGITGIPGRLANWVRHTLRRNTEIGSEKNIHAHYDIGNEFYELFLDDTMAYSSAIYPHEASSLEDAQRHKFDVICRRLELTPEDHLLEIGSGWGGLAMHAASEFGCRVTTVTVSRAQLEGARARIAAAGLSDRVKVEYCDYRRIEGKFDKVVSIEMLEAVGREYWDTFFAKIDSVMAPRGKALIQVICVPDLRFASYSGASDWIRKYVFPGGRLPSLYELQRSVRRKTLLETISVDEIGPHYAPTLRTWRERFVKNLERVRAMGFDEPFIRLWDFYLASCEASFATGWNRNIHLLIGRPESLRFCQRTGA